MLQKFEGVKYIIPLIRAMIPYLGQLPSSSDSTHGDTLATFPYVVARLACRMCPRRGRYRLARLAAEHGAEIEMTELLAKLAGKCSGREVWSRHAEPISWISPARRGRQTCRRHLGRCGSSGDKATV
jgi:hypothetical protein